MLELLLLFLCKNYKKLDFRHLSSDVKIIISISLTSVTSPGKGFLWVVWLGEVATQLLLIFRKTLKCLFFQLTINEVLLPTAGVEL